MLDEMLVDDVQLMPPDVRQLENADQVAHFFAKLRYNVDVRRVIPVSVAPYIRDTIRLEVNHHELIAVDPVDEDIKIYLFEVHSVTAKLRNTLAQGFLGTNDEKVLLVLTEDYSDLEFVFIERDKTETQRRGMALKPTARAIPHNVNRTNPEPVKLRVLKRFTFSEADSDYQWEKLRSAYMLAEWSEEFFNNRALFSDYYLNHRLKDAAEWKEDVYPAGREAYKHIVTGRANYSGKPEATIRKGFYEPMFAALGFDFAANPANASGTDEPDYFLYAKGDRTKPIAVALTTVWNRNLDDVDFARELDADKGGKPNEIPGALVVSVLERTQVAWVIVTNGKLWRLYSATASNKATNYYEVDLEEAIATTEQITALKYWWLMFRREAFTGFLDRLLTESEKYAKELGERLKDDVFLRIFPQFAKGFIAHMRGQGIPEADIDLDVVFSGTMTFLYRMMFILYAESLDLLPVNQEHGYGEYSLYALKRDLARFGGAIEVETVERLKNRYKPASTTIYERLKMLFRVVDKGSIELNMPTYNGGLFSAENESGRFLEQYAIPDQFLMLGLDRLTRDEDDKTKLLVFIDFKSLGVRQLGSIYEGLLEFKLNIAAEKLAVERDGKREIYIPLKQAKKQVVAVEKGAVYLENDKQERKATGSYYTPNYIVKYIVQHTVGPVLERKLTACEPRLRQAQREYREARALALKKGENPEKFWRLHEPTSEMSLLVDECLNVRVLDPAMGSGHFLVEVVDFVSNRLIDFLNGWSENPVWAALDRIREDILADMERQHVTIDADKLTRVALLKRAVLKRCVYGVDLNRMAVELAKVSLWLDAFTLGAPLSFLDHHLKWGNSLIGSRYTELTNAIKAKDVSLFAQNKFGGLAEAVRLMQLVSFLSDSTMSQAKESQQAFESAVEKLAPYKRVMDVYTSRWFGNAAGKGKRGAIVIDPTIEFINRDDTWAWMQDPRKLENRLPADDYMQTGLVAKTALQAAASKRFFHWEFEFPEVFFEPLAPGEQEAKLREDGGFDAVIGNPPWVDVQDIEESVKPYLRDVFLSTKGKFDLYGVFIERCLEFISPSGLLSMIFQSKFLVTEYGEGLRNALATKSRIRHMVQISVSDVFEAITTYPFILIASRQTQLDKNSKASAIVISAERNKRDVQRILASDNETHGERFQIDLSYLPKDSHWVLEPLEITQIALKAQLNSLPFSAFTRSINYGVKTNLDPAYLGSDTDWNREQIERELLRKAYKPRDIDRYELSVDAPEMIFPYDDSGELKLLNIDKYPKAKRHFDAWRSDLEKRRFFGKTIIEQGMRYYELPYVSSHSRKPKLVFPTVTAKATFAYDSGENLFIAPCYIIYLADNVDYLFMLAILNSRFTDVQLRRRSTDLASGYMEMQKQYVENLPIPRIDFATPADERERLTHSLIDLYTPGKRLQHLLQAVGHVMDSGKSDVIHDVLAQLAQRMIDLNKDKQAENKRFLGWLESKLKIAPKKDGAGGIDSLTGKTILQGYLGDYQKGQPEVSWKDYFYRLHQNRNRFGVALSALETEIEREYGKSLAALLPVKAQLARTDALIDKIVYQLYGLTDAEIELIERPQFEQGLADAKAEVVKDKETSDEVKIDKIAEAILPVAERYFERVEPVSDKERLDADLSGWNQLPTVVQTFLLTAEYTIRTQPEHLDFSTSVVSYTKSVETTLRERIFAPFRDQSGYSAADCQNDFLKKFMRGEKELTLGAYPIILSSSREPALRQFVESQISDAATRFYGVGGVVDLLKEQGMIAIRNQAAHDEQLDRAAAEQMRAWTFQILGRV